MKLNFGLFFFLFLTFTIIGCSLDDVESPPQFNFRHLPIENVTYEIHDGVTHRAVFKIYYNKENSCQSFSHFQYDAVGNTRNVSLVVREFQSENCTWEETEAEEELDFQPVDGGVYHFRFWAGKNADGEDTFIEESIQLP